MKLFFALFCLIPFLSNGQFVDDFYSFSEPVIVNSNSELGLSRPRIIIDNNGRPIVMWTSIDDKKIYISKYNGFVFSEPVSILPTGFTFYGNPNYGPEIDNNGDVISIVLHNTENELNNVYIIYSLDGGVSFSEPIKIAEEQTLIEGAGVHVNSNNISIVTYENLTFSGDANQMVGFGQLVDSNPGIIFENFIIADILTDGVPCECCLGHLTSNEQNLVFTYRNNINNVRNMFACTYNNLTEGFNQGFSIDSYDQSLSVCPTEGPKSLLLDNYLITAFKSYAYSPARMVATVYDLENNIMVDESVVDWGQGYGVQSLPEIAGNDAIFAVVWKEFRYYNYDVFISLKTFSLDNTEINPSSSMSISSSEPNSQTANDFTSVDIAAHNDEFHMIYLDDNDNILYYRNYAPNDISQIIDCSKNKFIIKTIDILGRETKSKGFQLEIYNDGSVERRYLLK
tara:strand:+ start:1117 stop:2481 length:1365 start_codon:yes stop_codon:yes gene_type:complete